MRGVIVNKSESRFCLEINQRPQKLFKQGQIVGVGKIQEDQSFYVGLVRWITEIYCVRILVGIEKIADIHFAVKCQLHVMNQKETLSALFLGRKVCFSLKIYC